MSGYQPFFSLNVSHSYFTDKVCQALEFVPSDATVRLMKNAGVIVRPRRGGINVIADHSNIDALTLFAKDSDDPFELQFKVFNHDPHFINYTEPAVFNAQGLLCFQLEFGAVQPHTSSALLPPVVKLHQGEWVDEDDFMPLSSLKEQGLVDRKDWVNRPCFIVSIRVGPGAIDDFCAAITPPVFAIRFQTKQTFWKYYVTRITPSPDPQICVVDLDDNIGFEANGQETLPGGQQAMTFTTKSALGLQQKTPYRFQLRSAQGNGSKVLIKRLPVAAVGQQYQAVIDGQNAALSEIYIHY
ncbi:MAG: hypothetical protein ACI8WB_001349 [Phenylobacterium sp.]|jgi:hypothetical protein